MGRVKAEPVAPAAGSSYRSHATAWLSGGGGILVAGAASWTAGRVRGGVSAWEGGVLQRIYVVTDMGILALLLLASLGIVVATYLLANARWSRTAVAGVVTAIGLLCGTWGGLDGRVSEYSWQVAAMRCPEECQGKHVVVLGEDSRGAVVGVARTKERGVCVGIYTVITTPQIEQVEVVRPAGVEWTEVDEFAVGHVGRRLYILRGTTCVAVSGALGPGGDVAENAGRAVVDSPLALLRGWPGDVVEGDVRELVGRVRRYRLQAAAGAATGIVMGRPMDVPSERSLADALISDNQGIRRTAERCVEAGGRELYPELAGRVVK